MSIAPPFLFVHTHITPFLFVQAHDTPISLCTHTHHPIPLYTGTQHPNSSLYTHSTPIPLCIGTQHSSPILPCTHAQHPPFLFSQAQSTPPPIPLCPCTQHFEVFRVFSPLLNSDDWQDSLCELGRERIQHPLYRQGDEMQGSRKPRSLPTCMSSLKEEPRSNPAHLEKSSIHFTAWSRLQPALSTQRAFPNSPSPSTLHRKHLFRQMFQEVSGWSPLPSCKAPSAHYTSWKKAPSLLRYNSHAR